LSRRQILQEYAKYAEQQELLYQQQSRPHRRIVVKPIQNLFHGEPNGKQFRIQLDANLKKYADTGSITDAIMYSINCLSDDVLDRTETVEEAQFRVAAQQLAASLNRNCDSDLN
jgi:hypothetical protein